MEAYIGTRWVFFSMCRVKFEDDLLLYLPREITARSGIRNFFKPLCYFYPIPYASKRNNSQEAAVLFFMITIIDRACGFTSTEEILFYVERYIIPLFNQVSIFTIAFPR